MPRLLPWKNSKATGAEWICRTLEHLDVEYVFGLPGTQNSTIFDALDRSSIRSIVPTHELAASFMANGYARASGRPGVLLTIPGPGFTYALSGVAEAWLDSVPIVWITLAPRDRDGRRFQLQAIEQGAIARPLVKEIFEIEQTARIASSLAAAHARAQAGEPGPVLVQLSEEALTGEARWEDLPARESSPARGRGEDDRGIAEAARRIARSRKLLVIAGQGARGAAGSLRAFVEERRALVLTTTSGRGVLPEDHPLSLGLECSGTRTEILDALVEAADTVLALGCKFSHNASRGFRWKIPPEKLIQVDSSEDVLEANDSAGLAIVSDAGGFLRALRTAPAFSEENAFEGGASEDGMHGDSLAARVEADDEQRPSSHADGWSPQEAEEWKKRGLEESWIEAAEPLLLGKDPARFFQTLREVLPRDGILVTDSGLHQLLARRYFRVDAPGGLIVPNDFQSMGFGLPAAIGAALADPSRRVVALIGDGGLLMSGLELLTAVKLEIPLCVFVINDGAYGLIRREQLAATGAAPGSTLTNPEFKDFARAVHAGYFALGGDAREGLGEALAGEGVSLVEVRAEDSPTLHRQRGKGALKRAVGPRMVRWLKGLLPGG